jgi:hypothetical protein
MEPSGHPLYDPAVLHTVAGPWPVGHPPIPQAFWAASRVAPVIRDVASGEKVACRFLLQGEHRGVFQGIAATGAHINLPGITILEFHDGRCIRRWSYTDSAGLLEQLGVLPSQSIA